MDAPKSYLSNTLDLDLDLSIDFDTSPAPRSRSSATRTPDCSYWNERVFAIQGGQKRPTTFKDKKQKAPQSAGGGGGGAAGGMDKALGESTTKWSAADVLAELEDRTRRGGVVIGRFGAKCAGLEQPGRALGEIGCLVRQVVESVGVPVPQVH